MKSLITIADIDRWCACCRAKGQKYSDENLALLLDGQPGRVPVELLHDERIPLEDRLWAVLRPDVLGRELYERFGQVCADRAVENHEVCRGAFNIKEAWACAARAVDAAARARVRTLYAAWAGEAKRAARVEKAVACAEIERQWQCEKLAEMIEEVV